MRKFPRCPFMSVHARELSPGPARSLVPCPVAGMKSRPGDSEETRPIMRAKTFMRSALDMGPAFALSKDVLDSWITEHNKKVEKENPHFKLTSWKREAVEAIIFKYSPAVREAVLTHVQLRPWEKSCLNVRIMRFRLWGVGAHVEGANGRWASVFKTSDAVCLRVFERMEQEWDDAFPRDAVADCTKPLREFQSARKKDDDLKDLFCKALVWESWV